MGNSTGTAGAMEGILATAAALNALFLEEERLEAAAAKNCGAYGVDVLDRLYQLRLARLELESTLDAQGAALKTRDAAQAFDLQQAMVPPDAPRDHRIYTHISAIEEIAGVLTISSGAAAAFVTQSRRICSLPTVYEALTKGGLSWQHAKIVAGETENLDHATAVALADHFLDPDAPNPARGCPEGDLVPSRFRAKVRTWRERHHPESIEKRHAKSVADRRVECTPDRDGMAWFAIHMPADSALAAWNKTTAIARGLQGPNETRTLPQLRADIAANLLLSTTTTAASSCATAATGNTPTRGSTMGGHRTGNQEKPASGEQLPDGFIGLATLVGSDEPIADLGIPEDFTPGDKSSAGAGEDSVGRYGVSTDITTDVNTDPGKVPTPRAEVIVTVPYFALTGLTDEPAMLDGYGPIPASMARKLLMEGADSFTRVLLDPRDGAPVEIGRRSYRVTQALRKALTLRDGKCTFPGCNNNALDNEADHLQAWQHGGTTGSSNLAQLCPKHHRLKHHSGWTPTEAAQTEPPGYTSPTGRHYPAEQPDREPPQWPAGMLTNLLEFLELPAFQALRELPELQDPEEPLDPGEADAWPSRGWFESAPPYEPAPLELAGNDPEDDNLIDPAQVPLDDPAWDEFRDSFYNAPFVLQAST